VLPEAGAAVSVTEVFSVKLAEHPVVAAVPFVMTQVIPAGFDVIVPLPFPPPVTVSVNVGLVTVTVTCLLTSPDVAVIEAVPAPTARTLPVPSTFATFVALDDHCTCRAVSDFPLALFGVAVIVCRWPTVSASVVGLTSIVDTATGVSVTPVALHVRAANAMNGAKRLGQR
jgi:hypothetical protein